ncbi:hypothetical protein P12x_000173 [Tundrisphaera lichenicola]|uniref:hypothetical protein n=1 Tax=Tundrisphaera lichenicola TaxID=2029860 RepID=UPI003EB847A5
MKKLALVTLLAVAASWLLFEDRPPVENLVSGTTQQHSRSLIRGHGGSRILIIEDEAPQPPAPPEPPSFPEGIHAFAPPEPPSPPEEIRIVRRRKADRARSGRVSTVPSTGEMPEWFPKSEDEELAKARPDGAGTRVLVGRLSASEDRARQDLRKTLEREVSDWIAADVPTSWKVPAPLIDEMVRGTYVQKVTRDLKPAIADLAPKAEAPSTEELPGLEDVYTLHRAGQQLDFSPSNKARIVSTYRRDLATRRMHRMGGGLALALGLLAVMTGYIRADEATRGYYTNRLRLAAVVGLGAAGVAAYRFLG